MICPVKNIESILPLVPGIEYIGKQALKEQNLKLFNNRSFKADGSVRTYMDKTVEHYLFEIISGKFPQANFMSEETEFPTDLNKEYLFILDPVDGTDSYSQGLFGWSVSLALCDREGNPMAGIIYAPRLDLMVVADILKPAVVNGHLPGSGHGHAALSGRTNIMADSGIFREINFDRFPGKVRQIGCASLHVCAPAIYPGIYASIQRRAYIWDIAAACAINRAAGYITEYLDGTAISFSGLLDKSLTSDLIISGRRNHIDDLKGHISRVS